MKAEPASDEEPEPDRPPKRFRSASSLALEQPTPPLAIPASPEEIASHLVEQARLGDLADTMSSVKATTYHCWPRTPNTELNRLVCLAAKPDGHSGEGDPGAAENGGSS